NGREGDLVVPAAPGGRARVRVIDTDSGPMPVWVGGSPFRVVAIDGTDVHQPPPVEDRALLVPAGGRADLEVVLPADGAPVRVHLGGRTGVVLGASGSGPAPVAQPPARVDLLTYGVPTALGFDPDAPDRRFEYDIGRRPGFLDGRPGL